MLRLVDQPHAPPALRRVSIWGVDPELGAYLERRLRARWPNVVVQHVTDAQAHDPRAADLWICGLEPPEPPPVPTLWLGEIDRSASVVRIGQRLWKCSMPITGRQLEHRIQRLWRESERQ